MNLLGAVPTNDSISPPAAETAPSRAVNDTGSVLSRAQLAPNWKVRSR